MKAVFDKIKELMARNATHRKGFRIADQTAEFHLKYAAGEMIELSAASSRTQSCESTLERVRYFRDELCEIADIFNCLVIYAEKRGFNESAIEQAMLQKLEARFDKEAACTSFKCANQEDDTWTSSLSKAT